MTYDYYRYKELEAKALSPEATKTDINTLGYWFERFGEMYWNGEYYEIDSTNRLYPLYKTDEDGELIPDGYEIR